MVPDPPGPDATGRDGRRRRRPSRSEDPTIQLQAIRDWRHDTLDLPAVSPPDAGRAGADVDGGRHPRAGLWLGLSVAVVALVLCGVVAAGAGLIRTGHRDAGGVSSTTAPAGVAPSTVPGSDGATPSSPSQAATPSGSNAPNPPGGTGAPSGPGGARGPAGPGHQGPAATPPAAPTPPAGGAGPGQPSGPDRSAPDPAG